ncbi:kinase-like domain-containing protein [Lipomyces japonicus]|uniref:kinase-like domain-containing protein n=1 Tax=Lipomyces japonicus TaxID=56871 RepID=UPI0034CDDC38
MSRKFSSKLIRQSTGGLSGSDHESSSEVLTVDYVLDNFQNAEGFKRDIVSLVHRLHISRWRHISLADSSTIKVTRISGALTNAVYCISIASEHVEVSHQPFSVLHSDSAVKMQRQNTTAPKLKNLRVPPLLLRVYGPNASQLIDRDKELLLLKRLASRNIGPRILGIFGNGRFEQYLQAQPLTKEDIRDPDISKVIAKRMRELHEGIDLTKDERDAGPSVWLSIQKWAHDAKKTLEQLDDLKKERPNCQFKSTKDILHTDWKTFVNSFEVYKQWLINRYELGEDIKKDLVFAHNDAQYGNLLRIEPPAGSPLLQPANEHRQLVVIDFEYSSPNVPAYDITNHFCEWMSDYHDSHRPQDIHTDKYPTEDEQLRFIQSYVTHGLESFDEIDKIDAAIEKIWQQSVNWRAAAHVSWCLWGIISAQLPNKDDEGFEDAILFKESMPSSAEFDYFDYASQKSALFWGEMKILGLPVPKNVDLTKLKYIRN